MSPPEYELLQRNCLFALFARICTCRRRMLLEQELNQSCLDLILLLARVSARVSALEGAFQSRLTDTSTRGTFL